jgi:hypothetical protein
MAPLAPQAPFKMVHRSTLGTDDGISDTHSIRSGRSLGSSVSSIVRHPDLHEPGLSASIVETVSAWFTNGSVDRAVQIGEVALAYNPTEAEPNPSSDTIRFTNFSTLEKVAPNPHFIDQIANKDGTYSVSLTKIPKTSVAFKYQVHLEPAHADTYAPLRIVPAWKVTPTQTLFMLSYSFNQSFSSKLSASSPSITLSNLILLVHVEPSSATISRCQASNGGTFAKERNVVYWRLGDITITKEAPAQVLKARLITDGEIKPGNVEARWELLGMDGLGIERLESSDAEEGEADPFADEEKESAKEVGKWVEVKSVRRLRSGTYVAGAATGGES